MDKNPFADFVVGDFSKENYDKVDLHRPYVDDIVLVSDNGEKLYREPDLIDVWFDSGAMPYAQVHFPFETQSLELNTNNKTPLSLGGLKGNFPADFIAEGVDQTRGWFFTLHALSTMLFDSVAFKNIISNGLVLDKNGNKMSKRLGNAANPFEVIETFGSDPLRWYMITNAQPWDNLKFDQNGIDEVKRKFFGTLYNTYSFFALYANVDGFNPNEKEIPLEERPEIDRWIISLLNSLVKETTQAYDAYEPTRAARAIQNFLMENLSNWYVRLNRKRFWGGEYSKDKIAAYQTLYRCLKTISMISAPVAPFFMDKLYNDLINLDNSNEFKSVHLTEFPTYNEDEIDTALEQRMIYAQDISSMVLSLRRKESLKVRQPLQKIMIPALDEEFCNQVDKIKDLVLSEVNVKELVFLDDTSGVLVKKIKPNFKALGPKYGKMMKQISGAINKMTQDEIASIEKNNIFNLNIDDEAIEISIDDVEIISEDIPGWLVANEGKITVALDINVTEELRQEGIAREFINRIQNLRKDSGFDVTDKITLEIQKNNAINDAIINYKDYIATQTLAKEVLLVDICNTNEAKEVEIDTDIITKIKVKKD